MVASTEPDTSPTEFGAAGGEQEGASIDSLVNSLRFVFRAFIVR